MTKNLATFRVLGFTYVLLLSVGSAEGQVFRPAPVVAPPVIRIPVHAPLPGISVSPPAFQPNVPPVIVNPPSYQPLPSYQPQPSTAAPVSDTTVSPSSITIGTNHSGRIISSPNSNDEKKSAGVHVGSHVKTNTQNGGAGGGEGGDGDSGDGDGDDSWPWWVWVLIVLAVLVVLGLIGSVFE